MLQSNPHSNDLVVLSTDAYITKYAESEGKKYQDIFAEQKKSQHVMNLATKDLHKQLNLAVAENKAIIWDQTNLTPQTRSRNIHANKDIIKKYHRVAVFFPTPAPYIMQERMTARTDQHIPKDIVWNMARKLQPPTTEEDFNEIWKVEMKDMQKL
jgi:predicted kinase